MTAPPLIWRSGSATGFLYSYAVYSELLRHLKKDREVTTVFEISANKLSIQSIPRSMGLMSGRCQRIIIDPSRLFWVPYKVRFNENTVTGPTSLVLVLFWEDWRVYLFLKVEQRYSSFASFPQLFEDSNKVLVRPRIELGSTATQSCIQTSSISYFSYEKVNFNVKNLC